MCMYLFIYPPNVVESRADLYVHKSPERGKQSSTEGRGRTV